MPSFDNLPDWERLLAAERHLQYLVPGSVLVGGTAAALHARHRRSFDGDHVVLDLRDRFEEVLAVLEAAAGWHTERVQKPVLILGAMDGILTGIRQLRRTQPDLAAVDLSNYRGLIAPWNSWKHIVERARLWAPLVARIALEIAP